jgi:cell division protein FtsX
MSDIQLSDVTIHIDKDATSDDRAKVEAALRGLDDVVSVHMPDDKPHLVVVEYNSEKTSSGVMLAAVREIVGHAELIGL